MTEQEAYIALNMVQGLGGVTVRAAKQRFGSVAEFFQASAGALSEVEGISRTRAFELEEAFRRVEWQREIERAHSTSIKLVTLADPQYPPLLASIHSPPLVLYVAGSVKALSAEIPLGVVGTRMPTSYGRENARSFSYRLALSGVTIVSGLARGIDTEAAEGAIVAKAPTIAVIGSALDRLYPSENRGLAHKIIDFGGAVISEYPFGRAADRQTFPMRNRIVSGLSLGILCIEAGIASGTLITTDHALEQGRSVMAIPGRISDGSAQGCHKLIKNGARLVESPADVMDEITSLPLLRKTRLATPQIGSIEPQRHAPAQPQERANTTQKLSVEEQKVLTALSKGELTPEQIATAAAISPGRISTLLMAMEMRLLITRQPGGIYRAR